MDPKKLPPFVLRRMAEDLRIQANDLDRMAVDADRTHQARLADIKHQRARRLAQQMVTDLLKKGKDPDEATARTVSHFVAQGFDLKAEDLEMQYRQKQRKVKDLARLNEDREIMALYRAGHKKAEIALKIGKHKTTIRRSLDRLLSDTKALREMHDTLARIKGRGVLHEVRRLSDRPKKPRLRKSGAVTASQGAEICDLRTNTRP